VSSASKHPGSGLKSKWGSIPDAPYVATSSPISEIGMSVDSKDEIGTRDRRKGNFIS
jgi:hypothetical protein